MIEKQVFLRVIFMVSLFPILLGAHSIPNDEIEKQCNSDMIVPIEVHTRDLDIVTGDIEDVRLIQKNTKLIQDELNKIRDNGKGTLIISDATHVIDHLRVPNCTTVTGEGNQSALKMAPNRTQRPDPENPDALLPLRYCTAPCDLTCVGPFIRNMGRLNPETGRVETCEQGNYGIVIRDLRIQGTAGPGNVSDCDWVETGTPLQRIGASDTLGQGILFEHVRAARLENLEIDGFCGDGIYIGRFGPPIPDVPVERGSLDITVRNNNIKNHRRAGIQVTWGAHISILENFVAGNNFGFGTLEGVAETEDPFDTGAINIERTGDANNGSLFQIHVARNATLDNIRSGIAVLGRGMGFDISVVDNLSSGNGVHGINSNVVTRIVVSGNLIVGNPGAGIVLGTNRDDDEPQDGVIDAVASNNEVRKNGVGISVGGNIGKNVQIVSNRIEANTVWGITWRGATDVTIVGNICKGNAFDDAIDYNNTSIPQHVVDANQCGIRVVRPE